MKAILSCLALGLPLSAVGADSLEYAVVSGVESLQRIRTGSDGFPWERAAPNEVIVSLSCGFARVVYTRVTSPGFARLNDDFESKPWKALVLLGHYCKLQEFVLDGWHLVAYRRWKGQDYLINFAEIRVGDDKRLYVDDSDFIEETGLGSLSGPDAQIRVYLDTIPMQADKSLERTRGR